MTFGKDGSKDNYPSPANARGSKSMYIKKDGIDQN